MVKNLLYCRYSNHCTRRHFVSFLPDSKNENTCTAMENYFAIFVPPRSFNIFWTNSMSVWVIKNYMDLWSFKLKLRSWVSCFQVNNKQVDNLQSRHRYFIGLPLIKTFTGKSIFVQLKFFSFDNEFIDMTVLTDSLIHQISFLYSVR
jgi:hypothetical protein